MVRELPNNKRNVQKYSVIEVNIFYMLFHPFGFTSISNCTPPLMSITGLETSLDVLLRQKGKVKVSLYIPLYLQLHSLLTSSLHCNGIRPHAPDTQSSEKISNTYVTVMPEQHTCLILYWFVIVFIDLFCLSDVIRT
jgi:hypothetical protein